MRWTRRFGVHLCALATGIATHAVFGGTPPSTGNGGDKVSPPLVLAYPGVEGAGAYATGGRGGAIVHVTNLDASGPGSLADAVSEPNRIVVFDVSGIIDLARKGKGGKLKIEQPNITIAGQSAPGEGICLRGGGLEVSAPNVIVRFLRSRRGFVADGDSGDALGAKPAAKGEKTAAKGTSDEAFEKVREKKLERGKYVHDFDDLDNVIFDHCSASWASDENLSVTHANLSTVSYCIVAEGLDYTNPRQTPPNHSEGSLWGCASPGGRATMHHMLYAHNRLRNPRTTGGADAPPLLTLYDCVVYDWSESPTHTGSERVLLDWICNTYKPGPSTPAAMSGIGFLFDGDEQARVYPFGNFLTASAAATADNRLAIDYGHRARQLSPSAKTAMIASKPLGDLPESIEPAQQAFATVLAYAGATLPARDAVDLRIVTDTLNGTGRVIEKETELPPTERWPDYRSLPPPAGATRDGIPEFWRTQFGLEPKRPDFASALTPSGYATIEHYLNNTDPRADKVGHDIGANIVFISATISRAYARSGRAGQWRLSRTGSTARPLLVRYAVRGDAIAGRDYTPLAGSLTIPAGAGSALLDLTPLGTAIDDRTAVITIVSGVPDYFAGCPAQSLIVIRR